MHVSIEHSKHSLNMRLLSSRSGSVGSVISECGQLMGFGELASCFGIGHWPPRKSDDQMQTIFHLISECTRSTHRLMGETESKHVNKTGFSDRIRYWVGQKKFI